MTRLLARFRRLAHIGRFGDPTDPWAVCWTPDGLEIR